MFVNSIFALSNIICVVQGFQVIPSINQKIPNIQRDAEEPLFLTPYIQKGEIEEGKKLARVSLTDELNITSYSGYITVNEKYDSNMFFWYFPAIQPSQHEAPVLVWLQGGPGASSMHGLLVESGPLKILDGKIVKREINWALNHHMIYIDNPVGTGFSFTNDSKGYCTEQVRIGEELHNMLTQFFKLFPEIQKNNFYISGECYAGRYIPALGYTIHKKNPTAEVKINLKGLAVGSGDMDTVSILKYDEHLYQLGLIDWNEAEKLREMQNEAKRLIKVEEYSKAHSLIDIPFKVPDPYNYMNLEPYNLNAINPILNEPEIQKAIHVGSRIYKSVNRILHNFMSSDGMKPVAPWLPELLDHYQVMTFNGQLDLVMSYPLIINYLRNLNFTGAEEYKTAPRYEWKVDNQIAGFVKQAGRLTEVMVRNAGHIIPLDQPKWAWDLITRFTHNIPLY